MSQYLTIYLKHRFNSERVELLCLCTTPARQMDAIGVFPFTEEIKDIENEDLDNYIALVKEELETFKKYRTDSEKTIEEYKEYLIKTSSKEVFEQIMEDIKDENYRIETNQEDIDEWEYYYTSLVFIKNIYKSNMGNWTLCYNNR